MHNTDIHTCTQTHMARAHTSVPQTLLQGIRGAGCLGRWAHPARRSAVGPGRPPAETARPAATGSTAQRPRAPANVGSAVPQLPRPAWGQPATRGASAQPRAAPPPSLDRSDGPRAPLPQSGAQSRCSRSLPSHSRPVSVHHHPHLPAGASGSK